MERFKMMLTKSIYGLGMIAALIAALSAFIGESFKTEEISALLVVVTVIAIYAVFNILFNKNKKIKDMPDIASGSFLFGMSMLGFGGICVRVLAFMLLNVDIMGWHALIAYIYTLICFSFIYIIGRLSQNHRSGLISSILYILLCSFDIYPVLENIKNGNPKTDLVVFYAGILFMLLSYIFVLLAFKAKTAKKSTALFLVSGIVMGVSLISDKSAVVGAVCMLLTIALSKSEYRYIGKQTMSSRLYKSIKGVLLFFVGFIFMAAAVIAVAVMFGIDGMIPEWVVRIQDFDSVNGIFIHVDSAIETLWSGIYFERNRFITYISVLVYVFSLVMCSVGCMTSAQKRKSNLLFAVMFPILMTILGIGENGDVSYICGSIPFVLLLAGCGVADSANIVYLKNSGLSENQLPVPEDINEKDIERIEKKYNLPKGCVGVSVVSGVPEDSDEDEFAEEFDDIEDKAVDDEPEDMQTRSGVASGDDLDDMLDDLFGISIDDDEDFSVSPSDVNEDETDDSDDEPKDGVVIFKDVIK